MRFLDPDVAQEAMAHAMREYPNESCGAVTEAGYVPLVNTSGTPKHGFTCDAQIEPMIADGTLLALIHSHPDGPLSPSERDMAQQIAMDLPWGIVASQQDAALPPWFWGPGVPVPPLVGRTFRYGPSGSDGKGDCAALVRDWYAMERGIEMPEFPRAKYCWVDRPGLYRDNLTEAGLTRISGALDQREPQVGDVFLMAIRSAAPNHVAIYQGNGLILHHLEGRLSRTEPFGAWLQFVTDVFRRV
jgi:proteasome lid subunit RPN8/RPN11